jgi:hypothetical protein
MTKIHHKKLFNNVIKDIMVLCCRKNADHFASIELDNGDILNIYAKFKD